jgi:hypothetical protein
MKTYLLIEKIMNGTVTMDLIITAIRANTFIEAKEKAKKMPNFELTTVVVDDENTLAFTLTPIIGTMKNEELKFI